MKHYTSIVQILFFLYSFPFCSNAQPWERTINRYEEDGMKKGAPYTLFDVGAYDKTITDRLQIIEEKRALVRKALSYPEHLLVYQEMFNTYYKEPNPDPSKGAKRDMDNLSGFAKCKAFICFVGIKPDGTPLSQADMEELKDDAHNALMKMNTEVLNMVRFHKWGMGLASKQLLYRTRELVNYLIAYDLLMAMGYYKNGALDANNDLSPRNNLRKFTRNIYKTGMGWGGAVHWEGNHSLGFSCAIGLASIVLNDAGVAWTRRYYKPWRWAKKAHKFLNQRMWEGAIGAGRQSVEGQVAGYGEGPGYYEYFMQGMGAQYLVALHNFIPNWGRDYLYSPQWDNLFQWRYNISDGNGYHYPYDNSSYQGHNSLLLLGLPKYNYLPTGAKVDLAIDKAPDFLALHLKVHHEDSRPLIFNMTDAGVTTMNLHVQGEHHYCMIMHEDEDQTPYSDSGHEDEDMGSFMIGVNQDLLVFDPPYLGWEEEWRTNNFSHHNTLLMLNDEDDLVEDDYILKNTHYAHLIGNPSANLIEFEMKAVPKKQIDVIRNFKMINNSEYGGVHYKITDRINVLNSDHIPDKIAIQINGNGSSSDIPFSFISNGSTSYWAHPCVQFGNLGHWYLAASTAVTHPAAAVPTLSENAANTSHQTTNHLLTKIRDDNEDDRKDCGYNSRVRYTAYPSNPLTIFLTILTPVPCGEVSPQMVKRESEDNASITIYFDKGTDIHAVKNELSDTLIIENPLDTLSSGRILKTNADDITLSMSTDSIFKTPNYCESYTYFRKASIDSGTFLWYDSTYYIRSTTGVKFDASYELTTKYRYVGNIYIDTMVGANVDAEFYLPDVDSGFAMVALADNVDSFYYNMSSRIMFVRFTPGASELVFELENPCLLSCYFPPTDMAIDTTFWCNIADYAQLAHNLEIVQNEGALYVTDQSHIVICPGHMLVNSDTIVMHGPDHRSRTNTDNCYSATDKKRGARTTIEVEDQSALILRNGSYTHVKEGASIIVRKGGTLLVQDGAHLTIGGDRGYGFGEVFVEEGAYLCVEEGADIRFFAAEGDTVDRNLFWFYKDPGSGTMGNSLIGVNEDASVFPAMTDSGYVTESHECTAICDFTTIMPPHGIYNREWGYFTAATPLATFQLSSEPICPGDSVIIDNRRILNEKAWEYQVCRVNPADSSQIDSTCLVIGNINPVGDGCIPYQYISPYFNISNQYTFESEGLYRITVSAKNGCDITHDTTRYVWVASVPQAYFELASTGCEGTGISVDSASGYTGSPGNIKHLWSVDPLSGILEYDTLEREGEPELAGNYGHIWEYDTIIDNHFDFPGYVFRGGESYVVTLEVLGACDVASWTDTIEIPLGVSVSAGRLLSANNYIGQYGIELNGVITGVYDSFVWYPPAELNRTDTLSPVTTTIDSTAYILTAFAGSCEARDTILIKHHEYSYLGEDRVVCAGDSIVIGNYLEASLIIGLAGYTNPTLYGPYFDGILSSHPDFRHRVSQYFYDHNYHFIEELEICWEPFIAFIKAHRSEFYTKPHYARLHSYFYSALTIEAYINAFKNEFMAEYDDLEDLFVDHMNNNGGIVPYRRDLRPCIETMMTNIIDVYDENPNGDSYWYINDVESPGDTNRFMITRQINQPTAFGMVVNGDYHVILVRTDTVAEPVFGVAYQTDSTIYFSNYTETTGSVLSYLWVFGDGDSSTLTAPVHTYPAFDSSYIVCLYATNLCGTYQLCDTLTVDSMGLEMSASIFNKKGNGNPLEKDEPVQHTVKLSNKNTLGANRPNPFDAGTLIDYELVPEFKQANITIVSMLGQEVMKLPLRDLRGTLSVDAQKLHSGMYYYSLVVDEVVVSTKIMVVR